MLKIVLIIILFTLVFLLLFRVSFLINLSDCDSYIQMVQNWKLFSDYANKTMGNYHCNCYKQANTFIVGGTHRSKHSNLLSADYKSLLQMSEEMFNFLLISSDVSPYILCISVSGDVPLTFGCLSHLFAHLSTSSLAFCFNSLPVY